MDTDVWGNWRLAVAERRKKVVHGETVGERTKLNQAPDGAKKICAGWFSVAPAGALVACWPDPRFHRELLSDAPPALGGRTDLVCDGGWPCASTQTLWVWLISGWPVGTNAVPKLFCDGRLGQSAVECLDCEKVKL
jgi:hypothetical protein